MIKEIYSDRPTFKRLKFKSGLNIIVADRAKARGKKAASTKSRRSRNGSGKSSFVDIVHFVLGGSVDKRTILSASALKDDTFGLNITIGDTEVRASRSLENKNRIVIEGDTRNWPVQPTIDKQSGIVFFDLDSWKDLLGRVFLGLPPSVEIRKSSYLSFRSSFTYFARRAHDGGFLDWTKIISGQRAVGVAVNLSHLVGLDPDVAFNLYDIKRREDINRELGKSIKEGFLKDAVGTTAEIRSELRKRETSGERLRQRLRSENIIDFYDEYESRANDLQREIDDLSNDNLIDKEYLEDLKLAIEGEQAPDIPQLKQLYERVGIVLPDVALKQYDDVYKFHTDVIRNRQSHLAEEADSTEERIKHRSKLREKLVVELDEVSGILKSGIARNNYDRIQSQLINVESEAKELAQRLKFAQSFESNRAELRVEKAKSQQALAQDHQSRGDAIAEASEIFESISAKLYEDPATLSIVYDDYATRYQIHKDNLKSEGVSNMQIFTFDLMLATLLHKRGNWPGFLIHDSHIFDGVDGRQIGAALRTAESVVSGLGGQYIVTMNSDDLEKATRESQDDFSTAIVKPTLKDNERGGLFGFRFSYGDVLDDGLGDDTITEQI